MFWKKKTDSNKEEKPKKKKKKKKLIIQATEETRQAYRVTPSSSEPIRFQFVGKEITVMDISTGGLSFKNDHFATGSSEEVSFVLPGENVKVSTQLYLLNILEAKNLCCCQFKELEPDDEDAINAYVLQRQKEELQSKKSSY